MADDPIWQVADRLWTMLEANADFAASVPAVNRVKYTDTIDRNPELDVPAESDYPRVRILLEDIQPWAFRTSNGSSMTLVFRIDLHVGDRRLHMISDVMTSIYYAFATWKTYFKDQTWEGTAFNVTCCRLKAIETDMPQDRMTTGWVGKFQAKVDLWQRTAAIGGT